MIAALMAIPFLGAVIKFLLSPIGTALGILAVVVAAYLFIDNNARQQERVACNARAEKSQRAAEQIDRRAGDNAGNADRNIQAEIDALWAQNKELINDLDKERSKPAKVVQGSCPDGDRLTPADVKRLRDIPER